MTMSIFNKIDAYKLKFSLIKKNIYIYIYILVPSLRLSSWGFFYIFYIQDRILFWPNLNVYVWDPFGYTTLSASLRPSPLSPCVCIKIFSILKKVYMCVKLPPRNLNFGLCPPHPTNTYTCEVTIAQRVCGDLSSWGLNCEA